MENLNHASCDKVHTSHMDALVDPNLLTNELHKGEYLWCYEGMHACQQNYPHKVRRGQFGDNVPI